MLIFAICTIAALLAVATYLLLPLPLLSYRQGELKTDNGQVTDIKNIRPGVVEISLTQGLKIDPRLQEGNVRMIGGSITRYVHFRKWQTLPEIGDEISVSSGNRLHHFTGRSFNWVKSWSPLKEGSTIGGRVELVTG